MYFYNKKKKKKKQYETLFEKNGGLEKGQNFKYLLKYLSTFSSDTTSKLNILGHDGDSFSVDSTQVGIFEKTN